MRGHGDLPLLGSKIFLPESKGIRARRQVLYRVTAVFVRNCKIRIVYDSDKGMHPAMNIAFHANHDFWFKELPDHWRIARALTMVPFPVDLGHWMNVMSHRVRVSHFENLSCLDADNSRPEPAAILIH